MSHSIYFNAEIPYSECLYADCCYADCHFGDGRGANFDTRWHHMSRISDIQHNDNQTVSLC